MAGCRRAPVRRRLPGRPDADRARARGRMPAPEMEEFVHEPDLEEAAIRFANGDYAGAEAGLLEVLERHSADEADAQFEIWMTLFDLYRATGQQDPFDMLAIEFAARFGRSAPLWFSLPEQLGMQAAVDPATPAAAQFEHGWSAPTLLTQQSVAALQASLARGAPPWTLTWSRLAGIDDAALTALAQQFEDWAGSKGADRVCGRAGAAGLLQAHTQSGDRAADPEWWRLRMAALRLMGHPDEFEMVALDYCVTYEVSPPSWVPPRCGYSDGDDGERCAAGGPCWTWRDSASVLTGPAPVAAGAGRPRGPPLAACRGPYRGRCHAAAGRPLEAMARCRRAAGHALRPADPHRFCGGRLGAQLGGRAAGPGPGGAFHATAPAGGRVLQRDRHQRARLGGAARKD